MNTNNFPDPSAIFVDAQHPFNLALSFFIGGIATILIIQWIIRSVKNRETPEEKEFWKNKAGE
jgi:hypothetical protein